MQLVNAKIRLKSCSSCPFHPGGLELTDDKMTQIKAYLAEGQNHLCHSDTTNKTVCRGGRQYQLNVFHARGWISEPTDEALREAMSAFGISPKAHI